MSSESEVVVDNQAEEVPVVVDCEMPTEPEQATAQTEAEEAQAPAAADVTPEVKEDVPAEVQSEQVSAETEEAPAAQPEEEKPTQVNDEAKEEVAPAPEAPSDEARFQAVHEKALEAKDQGTSFYKAQQFTSAKVKYGEALASIQVGRDIDHVVLLHLRKLMMKGSVCRTNLATSRTSNVPSFSRW